ncbi:MAG TPA: HRDC domain-containing protein [Pirellulales bacterium]|nr:HRDC domain-containing protein [Pirellulales bacterium]
MAFKFFQVPIREFQAIEVDLNAFLRGHRVLSVDRRWVDLGQDSFWSICIDYLDGDATARVDTRNKGRAKDYKELLSPEDFAVFVKLRDLRKEVAQAEAVPVYTIFTNEQLAGMVQSRVQSKNDLESIAGVGDARSEKYGPRFLACLQEIWKKADATGGPSV